MIDVNGDGNYSFPELQVAMPDMTIDGFTALESMPEWYQYTLGVIVAASFGVRSATKFFGGKK